MADHIELLDTVALTEPLPALELVRGQAGTVVEMFKNGMVEVEFADENGRMYAQATVAPDRLLKLHHRPAKVA